jgi:protein-tyrosine-phosphatase
MEAIDIIERAIALYKKVKDLPEQIGKIVKRMESLDVYLRELQDLLDVKKNPGGLVSLRSSNVAQLNTVVKDIKADGEKVYDLLIRWDKNIGPGGLVFRFDWFAHLVYGLGSSPDKLDALAADIERHLNDINRFIVLLISHAQNQQLLQSLRPPPPSPALRSRSPSPKAEAFNILFIDGHNVGRSKVAEAYCRLLYQETIQNSKQSQLKMNKIDSAGILPTTNASCIQELVDLGEKLIVGDLPPNSSAMKSVFDNKSFDFPYKEDIKKKILRSRSRGLSSVLFSRFDFIVVFTKGHEVKMIKLREILLKKHGSSARSKNKGRIVLLGDYLGGKAGGEIYEAAENNWPKTTATIKLSVKALLKKEMGWIKPKQGGK